MTKKTPEQAALEDIGLNTRHAESLNGKTWKVVTVSNETYETIRKALADKQWRDISTAPRDGTEILVMLTMKKIGKPETINVVANARWIERDNGDAFWHDLEGIMDSGDVEYWMPLPDAPPSGGEGK